ncbi:MAG: MFS transporter [Bacteroidales bacterium]
MIIFRGLPIPPDTLKHMFRALKYPNYRLYYGGQSISLIGVWVQNIAMGWLVYRLTGSALLLGTVAFFQQIPSLFITPFAGVLADRMNRQRVIILSQAAAMVVAFILAALVLTDAIKVYHILLLAGVNGVILAFDTPFRQSFVPDMIPNPEDLTNAIALNSSLYNMARFVGPPIGGVLIATVGEGWCFFINGVSFLAVIAGLMAMRIPVKTIHKVRDSVMNQLKEGIHYAWNEKPLRYLLMLVALSSFFGLPFQALLPVFAADVLQGDSELLGILTGALGAGALTGAFYLAARKKVATIPVTIFRTALIFSLALGLFALSSNLYLSMAALAITGFGMIVHFNSTNTILQIISHNDKRGRVVSLYSLTFMGITPLGSLLAGGVSEAIGVPYTVFLFSLVCIGSSLLYGKRLRIVFVQTVRRIRQRLATEVSVP